MLGDDAALDAAQRWVDDWQSGIEEQAARARALSQRVSGLTATATSDDGLVEVTVGSSGALTGLRLDEAIRQRPAAQTAGQILAVTRAALARLTEQAAEAVAETVGEDSPTGQAVIDSYANRLRPPLDGDADAAR
jgi:DNA-binding protein YbaB